MPRTLASTPKEQSTDVHKSPAKPHRTRTLAPKVPGGPPGSHYLPDGGWNNASNKIKLSPKRISKTHQFRSSHVGF